MTPWSIEKADSEHSIQSAFFCYANMACNHGFKCADDEQSYIVGNYAKTTYSTFNAIPSLKWLHAIPNGGQRNKIVAMKLKAEGVKKGVHDVFLPVESDYYNGLYIEFKAGKNKMTKEQEEFKHHILKNNFKNACVNNLNDGIITLKDYYEKVRF